MLRPIDIQTYRLSEVFTGLVIYPMVLFSPWAFGTSQPWAVWCMNYAGYALGVLLFIKLGIRWFKGYQPSRWNPAGAVQPVRILAWITVAILAYVLISALNAKATYIRDEGRFEYRQCLSWLPYSLDATRTWYYFWTYLGLACSFWAICDWLLGKDESEENNHSHRHGSPELPLRLRRLVWILCLNGALLAIEGIIQRIEGSGRLLFLVQPRVNPGAIAQFGPYAYRANASQYFNLLWPLCIGFWWTLHRHAKEGHKRHHILILCAILMAASPIISTSRGGAIIMGGMGIIGVLFVAFNLLILERWGERTRSERMGSLIAVLVFLLGASGLGYALGWKDLAPRMSQVSEGFDQRQQMYESAKPMVFDYPFFGTGAGTFEPVFQLYRKSIDTYWPAQLHNDWLETLITFGFVGFSLAMVALICVLIRWYFPGGIQTGRRLIFFLWLALAGALVHATLDFPFQMHSIVLLFLIECALLAVLTRRRRA